ncbi:MAG: T9SS type A sorting domain-containing protein [Flavobacteriales bacterium]|nr:T9SS type A sorting domain-containing protein [Flavobacteriales bacterium]
MKQWLAYIVSLVTTFGQAQVYVPEELFGESYAAKWTYLRNNGQVHDLNGDFSDETVFHSVGTNPTLYAQRGSRTVWTMRYADTSGVGLDTIVRVDMTCIGEEVGDPLPVVLDTITGHYNFYEEFTPTGITGVGGGKRVVYEEVWKKIDYHILSNRWGPKFLFVVKPGGDPQDILLMFEGQDSLDVDVDGFLRIHFGQRYLKLNQAVAYQMIGGAPSVVSWIPEYAHVEGSTQVSVTVGAYNAQLPLIFVITPFNPLAGGGGGTPGALPEWGTFLSGSHDDAVTGLDHDDSGNLYFCGYSKSTSGLPVGNGVFQTPAGDYDAVVGRFNQYYEVEVAGTWMTYIGGTTDDRATGVSWDEVNNRIALVGAGLLPSSFPNVPLQANPNCYQSTGMAFVSYLEASTGSVEYATKFSNGMPAWLNDVDFDSNGNAYVVGHSYQGIDYEGTIGGPAFFFWGGPENGPMYHTGLVAMFSAQADLVWCTAIGGPGDEWVWGCEVDPLNNRLYVVGETQSPFDPDPLVNNCEGGNTHFQLCDAGGWFQDRLNGAGQNQGPYNDGFIMGFDLSDRSLFWSTFFGGQFSDQVTDVVVDDAGNIYVTGYTESHTYNSQPCTWNNENWFPKCDPGFPAFFQPNYGNNVDGFVAKFSPGTDLLWSSYIGGSHWDGGSGHLWMNSAITWSTLGPMVYMNTNTHNGLQNLLVQANDGGGYFQGLHADGTPGVNGNPDTYLIQFDADGSVYHASYFGGFGLDIVGDVDAFDGRVYVAGATGNTSGVFPLYEPTIAGHTPYLNDVPDLSGSTRDGFLAQVRYDLTVGVADGALASSSNPLLIVPNPATTTMTIRLSSGVDLESVEVFDVGGRRCWTEATRTHGSAQLDVSRLSTGVYVVRAADKNGRVTLARFVKQ